MTTKAYTDLEQSKVLSKILPPESADMSYHHFVPDLLPEGYCISVDKVEEEMDIPCWSLAALLNILHNKTKDILHNKTKDIPSLSGGGYKAGKYTSDWCLDYEFENGDYKTTFADNPVDACYNMIIKLNELKML